MLNKDLKKTHGKNGIEEMPAIKGYTPPNKPANPKPIEWKIRRCLDPSHNPPTMLYIPPGETHIHVCPSCKTEVIMRGADIYC